MLLLIWTCSTGSVLSSMCGTSVNVGVVAHRMSFGREVTDLTAFETFQQGFPRLDRVSTEVCTLSNFRVRFKYYAVKEKTLLAGVEKAKYRARRRDIAAK